MKKYVLAPSLLGANFLNLEAEIDKCLTNGVDWIHYDVMDFHFVPNLTFGAKVLKDLTSFKPLNVDIHFMVEIKDDYDFFFKDYIQTKPKMMTMHIESLKTAANIEKFITICKQNNILASLAISPKTPVEAVLDYLNQVDNILVMSVEPGFGGQKFQEIAVEKIAFLNNYRQEKNLTYTIEVDGGINNQTVGLVKQSGVDMIVTGSYFFESATPETVVKEMTSDYGTK